MQARRRLPPIDDLQSTEGSDPKRAVASVGEFDIVGGGNDAVVICQEVTRFLENRAAQSGVDGLAAPDTEERADVEFKETRSVFFIDVREQRGGDRGHVGVIV